MIAKHSLDILFLQEVASEEKVNIVGFEGHVQVLKTNSGGVATLWRKGLETSKREQDLTIETKLNSWGIEGIATTIDNTTFLNIYLNPNRKPSSIRRMFSYLEELDFPIAIIGDFNASGAFFGNRNPNKFGRIVDEFLGSSKNSFNKLELSMIDPHDPQNPQGQEIFTFQRCSGKSNLLSRKFILHISPFLRTRSGALRFLRPQANPVHN